MMAGSSHMKEIDSDLLILNEKLMGYVSVCMDNTVDVAQDLAEYCSDDESMKQVTKDIMLDFLEMENEIQQHVKALTHVQSVGVNSEQRLLDVFKDKLQQVKAMEKKDFKEHPKYTDLEERLSNVGNIQEQLETLRATLSGASGDEEVAVTSYEINIKCPFTGQVMVNPVRNKICNHVYDRDGILAYINSRKAKARCPISGCESKNPVRLENLEDHKDMKKYITLMGKYNP